MSNSLDPDQARHFVGPDLDPNHCKGFQLMTLVGKELTARLCFNDWQIFNRVLTGHVSCRS